MQISQVMTASPVSASAEDSIRAVAAQMDTGDFGSIPVCEGSRIVGVVTDRDIAVRGVAQGLGPDTAVREVMTPDPVCVTCDTSVAEAAELMQQRQLRRLYVTDEDQLVGVVALADVAREASAELSGETIEAISQ